MQEIMLWNDKKKKKSKQGVPLNMYKLWYRIELYTALLANWFLVFTCVLNGKAPSNREQAYSKTNLAPSPFYTRS